MLRIIMLNFSYYSNHWFITHISFNKKKTKNWTRRGTGSLTRKSGNRSPAQVTQRQQLIHAFGSSSSVVSSEMPIGVDLYTCGSSWKNVLKGDTRWLFNQSAIAVYPNQSMQFDCKKTGAYHVWSNKRYRFYYVKKQRKPNQLKNWKYWFTKSTEKYENPQIGYPNQLQVELLSSAKKDTPTLWIGFKVKTGVIKVEWRGLNWIKRVNPILCPCSAVDDMLWE